MFPAHKVTHMLRLHIISGCTTVQSQGTTFDKPRHLSTTLKTPQIRESRIGWSLSHSNAQVWRRSQHGRVNPEAVWHIHKAIKIPDQKVSGKMGPQPRKSNGPCQDHNHKILEVILMVPSTFKCRSHIQILKDAPQGRNPPQGWRSNLWSHWTTGAKIKPKICPPA